LYVDGTNVIQMFDFVDINGGAIDGTVIGAATPAAATVTVLTATADSAFTSTGAVTVSKGTTGERPGGPVSGMFRFNTTTAALEVYNGTGWGSVGSGVATGGGADEIFIENEQTVTANYSIPSLKNALSTGPISVNSGITVTVPTGSRWVVI
jgi:hypothetical protein